MTNETILRHPQNRVVSVFDERLKAEAARQELSDAGISESEILLLHGEDAAMHVDTSKKWFADTDEEIKRYKHELLAGNTVVTIPVSDAASREKIHTILKHHDARLVTHFGKWVTKMLE